MLQASSRFFVTICLLMVMAQTSVAADLKADAGQAVKAVTNELVVTKESPAPKVEPDVAGVKTTESKPDSAPATPASEPVQASEPIPSAGSEIAKSEERKPEKQAVAVAEKAAMNSAMKAAVVEKPVQEPAKEPVQKPAQEIAQKPAVPEKANAPSKPAKSKYKDPFPADILRIKERGKLVVAQFHGERKGFFMADKGQFPENLNYIDAKGKRMVGHDIEMAMRIAERLGVDLEVRRDIKSFNDITRAVGRGEADLGISKITITMSRGQYVRFSDPYVKLKIGVLINRLKEVETKREGSLFEILDHPEAKIAVQRGTSWVAIGKDLFPQAQLVEYPNMNAALDAVSKGETLGFLNDEWNLTVKLNEKPETTLRARLAFVPERTSGIAVAVNPQAPNLLSFVNLMIEADNLKTTPDKLVRRFFTESAQSMRSRMSDAAGAPVPQETPMAAMIAIGISVLILLFLWFRMALTRPRA